MCVASEGANQLTIRPKITELKDAQGKAVFLSEDGMRIVVILYADLHRYFLLYESLRHAARTCVIPSTVATAVRTSCTQVREQAAPCEHAVLRAWLGLTVSALSYTYYFFGDAEQRPALIARAEAALDKQLSDNQRKDVLAIYFLDLHSRRWEDIVALAAGEDDGRFCAWGSVLVRCIDAPCCERV